MAFKKHVGRNDREIMSTNATRNILIFLLFFVAIGAIGGGGVLIISPSGEMIGLPLAILKSSPFNSFLIPGIILLVVLGITPLIVCFGLLKRPESPLAERLNFFKDMHWAWSYSTYVSFALIIWLQTEMFFIQGVSWLHNFYMVLALMIIFLALMPQVRFLYKK